MTGTFINVGAVLASGVLARLGLITLVVGVDLALAWRETDPLYVLGGVSSF